MDMEMDKEPVFSPSGSDGNEVSSARTPVVQNYTTRIFI
jgi:hypothetical protein